MSAAMRSRFVFVPVLQPLAGDMPAIVAATASRVQPGLELDLADTRVVEAARIFHRKGASPRHVRSALTNALMFADALTADGVLRAARDLEGMTDGASAIYADLWAIRCCAFRRFLPWSDDPQGYPYPEYLQGLVDPATGEVEVGALECRIAEHKPHANV
jgi:hypothetical protein